MARATVDYSGGCVRVVSTAGNAAFQPAFALQAIRGIAEEESQVALSAFAVAFTAPAVRHGSAGGAEINVEVETLDARCAGSGC